MLSGKSYIKDALQPIVPTKDRPENWKKLMTAIGDAQVVMIGEASHGTHEFYELRAEITKHLIQEKGFRAVCVEADWPDAYRVNRFVHRARNTRDLTPKESLRDFVRFPLWMWRNEVVEDFVGWLRGYNDFQDAKDKIAFYGLDFYSMFSSMSAVIDYLQKVSPKDAKKAASNYSKFDRFQCNPSQYGFWAGLGMQSLESEVVDILEDMRTKKEEYLHAGHMIDGDELFFATRNAALVKNAEEYYRKMYHCDAITWNIRDSHMADTVQALMDFMHEKNPNKPPKVILWAHNSHLGDARASENKKTMAELNLGQLMRQQFGLENTFNIGFGTSLGTVTASRKWEEPGYLFQLQPGIPSSYEKLFHKVAETSASKNFMLLFRANNAYRTPQERRTLEGVEANDDNDLVDKDVVKYLSQKARYERYIGVIYKPHTQKLSHCSMVDLPKEFDAYIYLDSTRAVKPLDNVEIWSRGPPTA